MVEAQKVMKSVDLLGWRRQLYGIAVNFVLGLIFYEVYEDTFC
jgi:hypothetical protein